MIGKRLAHYEILESIGEGGMGQVFRARDTTLDRDVALKVLPEHFLLNAERLARFEREAKVLASLNHAGIASIYGFHHQGDVHFLVMELAPGPDLSQRLDAGPIPVEEALPMAAQIAEALEYAHEQNIVHRDLKPANVKADEGKVKVLDFGLAKAFLTESETGDPGTTPSMLPTVTTGGTRDGVVLGTAAYMSPEQARGQNVDRRADIWAFGCLLYEMLTGRRLFPGDTVSDTIAAVLRADIDLSDLPGETPPSVRFLLERCLDRDKNTRLRDIGEARIALSNPEASMAMRVISPPEGSERASGKTPRVWMAMALLALLIGIAAGKWILGSQEPAPPARYAFEVNDPGTIRIGSLALSPDGANLVYSRRREDGTHVLVLRKLADFGVRDLAGTEGAEFPFWSPDGAQLGFFVRRSLYRMALDGTSPQRVADLPTGPLGGTWNREGLILFGSEDGPIYRINQSGGEIDSVTTVDREWEMTHAWPAFLPDGRHFVFLADASTDEGHRLYAHSLDGKVSKILRKGVRSALLVDPQGYILLSENSQVLALPVDFKSLEVTGGPVLVEDGISPFGDHHQPTFTLSENGAFAYRQGSDAGNLVHVSLDGQELELVGENQRFRNPAVSMDGSKIAYEIAAEASERVVWVEDLARGVKTQVSERGALADSPVWSHDGTYLYFGSNLENNEWLLYRKDVNSGKPAEEMSVPGTGSWLIILDASNDGRHFLLGQGEGAESVDLFLGTFEGDSLSWAKWADLPGAQTLGRFSPDSRWIVYQSNESGQDEIYVASVAGGPAHDRYVVSPNGGMDPNWSPDGTMITYRTLSEELVTVPVTLTPAGLTMEAPQTRFGLQTPFADYIRNGYDYFPDGKSLLVWITTGKDVSAIRVRTRWKSAP